MSKKLLSICIILMLSGIMLYHYVFADGFSQKKSFNLQIPHSTLSSTEESVEQEDLITYSNTNLTEIANGELKNSVEYVSTPDSVRAIYMTSWIAGRKDLREDIRQAILENPSVNAVVIDIKDDTGKISFPIDHPLILELGSSEKRIQDIESFITELHADNIYVIGRIAVFQDPYLAKKWPDQAVLKKSNPEEIWEDRKGLSWMDPSSEKVWDYVGTIAEEAHAVGFDEINFDYIRFPSDGNMKDILLPITKDSTKSEVIESFFQYLQNRLTPQGIVISADIFGMTTVNNDDLGIGQILEKTIPYFDYVSPMVYPSHFPKGWAGLENPAAKPYDVIIKSMSRAVERTEAMGESKEKLRPWLQDFNLGADYTPELVQDQIKATYELGLDSWLMWDPRNTYTFEAFSIP